MPDRNLDKTLIQPESVLTADRLTLAWEDVVVTEEVSLHVLPGEVCCLVGKSGCGKTTILHALAGLTKPVSGRVLVHGCDVTGKPGRVSYMLQKDLLLEQRRVIDNVALPLVLKGVSKREARAAAEPLFERFGLAGTQMKWPHQLSGGMRQRAALLRTHLMGNDCILLDEPFSALDAMTRMDMREWFLGIVKDLGLSALIITHDVDEAVCLSSRVYVLSGSPSHGTPSRIADEITIDRGDLPLDEFELTYAYADAKRRILDAIRH
ncbi:Sulfate/thiosulfate import ATP-binding protein CysA [Slackia heliotrinireducens]|uniref:ABC transporter ATP-binding protein n=1 Tax=Slackia heliotrinireducens TaxID=84110 RepID=UPI0006801365|nr:ABC transporter ATP-binding protein [Slackia heliotrinireducens]VEH00689.1 Sulfate/thiosulfate import ATP-binding protein CysA [Slackia heliotrinireducens]